jgi:UDP-N-acetylmuramate dehydrogenase
MTNTQTQRSFKDASGKLQSPVKSLVQRTKTFHAEAAYAILHERFTDRIHLNEPLSLYSTFHVGGPADILITIKTRYELIDLVRLAMENQWPLLLIGNGSNILFTDAGVRGIVARIAIHGYNITEETDTTALLRAGAGSNLQHLASMLTRTGWGGLEFGIGIPGTLGGSIVSNAGAHKHALHEILEWVEVLDTRAWPVKHDKQLHFRTRYYTQDELDLSYRYSRFRSAHASYINEDGELTLIPRTWIEPAEIILTVAIRLHRTTPGAIAQTIDSYTIERLQTEPSMQRYTGSIFKDPEGSSAAQLVEQVGMQNMRIGDACISTCNPNYIINLGNATTNDIVSLIEEAHRRVKKRFGIHLELNVELRGELK